MNDPLIARFAEACGAIDPLNLRVDLPEGGVLAEGNVHQPFTLIGRDDACDVTLTDPEVNLRHAWLQVIGGQVYAIDLGSRTGLVWPDRHTGCGWLDIDTPVRIGPFRLHLCSPPSPSPAPISRLYDPLRSDAALCRARPPVFLEFRNGKRVKDRWAINRIITLIGQADACKIHLNSDDIAGYHCGLVLTPTGLWVVDLSGRGVVVNGERMRVAPLPHGAELWVGRFLIGCHYPAIGTTPPLSRPGTPTPPTPRPALPTASELAGTDLLPLASPLPPFPPDSSTIADIPEDEVPLGVQPPPDPASGLPSSHIMADAFRVLAGLGLAGNSGPVSSPILVSGTGPSPSTIPVPPDRLASPPPDAPTTPQSSPLAETLVAPLLRQLAEIHGQMFEQFQQSLLLVMQVFGKLPREQMTALQSELTRIQELNAELGKLQTDVARLAVARVIEPPVERPTTEPHDTDAAAMELTPVSTPVADATAVLQEWVVERINALQRERQSRWQKLVGHFSGTTEPGT